MEDYSIVIHYIADLDAWVVDAEDTYILEDMESDSLRLYIAAMCVEDDEDYKYE